MAREGSKSWKTVLYELLTRANEITLIKQVFGKDDADKVYNDYLKKGYTYLNGLLPLIEQYNQHRDKYKTLDDIMPALVAFFDAEAKANKSPSKPMN